MEREKLLALAITVLIMLGAFFGVLLTAAIWILCAGFGTLFASLLVKLFGLEGIAADALIVAGALAGLIAYPFSFRSNGEALISLLAKRKNASMFGVDFD